MRIRTGVEWSGENHLLNGGRPGENKPEEYDEEEGTPEVPILEGLPWILPIRVGEYDELQITDDAGQIALDGVPDGLGEGVGRGPEALDPGGGGGRSSNGGDRGGKGLVRGGMDGRGDGDLGAGRAGGAGGGDGGMDGGGG